MITTITRGAHSEEALRDGWGELVRVFSYANATVSEAELYDSPTSMKLDNTYIAEIVAWAIEQDFMEPAEESDRFRLTTKGVKAWRASREPV